MYLQTFTTYACNVLIPNANGIREKNLKLIWFPTSSISSREAMSGILSEYVISIPYVVDVKLRDAYAIFFDGS